MNQGKLEVVKQEMARVNVDILGIREIKWTGKDAFNSDDHYIYYCGQESLRRNWSSHHLFDHFQFALIHGPNIPGSYAILLFTTSDFTSHHQSHPQLGIVFALALSLHSFWS